MTAPTETRADRLLVGVLVFDAVLLAVIELMFLPLYLGQVQFPITAALAAVSTPLLVSAMGRITSNRLVTAMPLIAWFATILVFGTSGPGGDVMLLGNDWRSYLLIGAGTLPSALMLGVVQARQTKAR